MRLDRAITLNFIRPLLGIFLGSESRTHSGTVPILMYHSISDDPVAGVHPYHQTHTTPAIFHKQMQHLAEQGYRTVTLDGAVEMSKRRRFSPDAKPPKMHGLGEDSASFTEPGGICAKKVAITFDDGFRNFYTHAFPVLQEYGFTATMFLPTGFIVDESCQRPESRRETKAFAGKEFLTWAQVKHLHDSGVQFGSHTVTHPRLVDLSNAEIEFELRNSKLEIEARLGKTVNSFAYPFAFPQGNETFLNSFRGLLNGAGYNCCVTTEIGRMKAGDDPCRLKRLPVNSCDDVPLFRSKLEGGYDWLAYPQRAAKTIKHWTCRSVRKADEVHRAEAVPT